MEVEELIESFSRVQLLYVISFYELTAIKSVTLSPNDTEFYFNKSTLSLTDSIQSTMKAA